MRSFSKFGWFVLIWSWRVLWQVNKISIRRTERRISTIESDVPGFPLKWALHFIRSRTWTIIYFWLEMKTFACQFWVKPWWKRVNRSVWKSLNRIRSRTETIGFCINFISDFFKFDWVKYLIFPCVSFAEFRFATFCVRRHLGVTWAWPVWSLLLCSSTSAKSKKTIWNKLQ